MVCSWLRRQGQVAQRCPPRPSASEDAYTSNHQGRLQDSGDTELLLGENRRVAGSTNRFGPAQVPEFGSDLEASSRPLSGGRGEALPRTCRTLDTPKVLGQYARCPTPSLPDTSDRLQWGWFYTQLLSHHARVMYVLLRRSGICPHASIHTQQA